MADPQREPGRPASAEPGAPGSRREARERALTLLYEAEAKDVDGAEVVAGLAVPPEPFTVEIVEGVDRHRDEIDRAIAARSGDWPLDRMATIDRAVLRMATHELLHRSDIPPAVTINEAVELAKRFSTDDSGRFVNGLLAAVARDAGRTPDTA